VIEPDAARFFQDYEPKRSFVAFLAQHLHEDRKDSLPFFGFRFEPFVKSGNTMLFMSFERVDAAVFRDSFQHSSDLFDDTLLIPWLRNSSPKFEILVPFHLTDI